VATGRARTLDVLRSFVDADLRARFGTGPWRPLKWLIDPIAFIGVYLVLVVFVVDRGGTAPGLIVACAVIPFQLLVFTVADSLTAVARKREVIVNFSIPQMLLPASSTLTRCVPFAVSLALLPPLMLAYGVAPTWTLSLLPLALVTTFALALALAYPAALLGIWMPELAPLASLAMRALFFLAAGVVALAQVPGGATGWIKLNPLTGLFEAYRSTVVYGEPPAAWELLYPLGFAAMLFALFVPLYRREERHFAKLASYSAAGSA